MKIVKLSINEYWVLFLFIAFMISCGTVTKTPLKMPTSSEIAISPLPLVFYTPPKTDTPKALTEAQKQILIDKFYQYGYKKYYGPEFDKLARNNKDLAAALRNFSDYMITTRHRMDSISHERNYYRNLENERNKNELEYRKESQRLANQLLINERKDAEDQKRQVTLNSVVANVALMGVIALVGILVGLYRKVRSIDKKFGHLLKTTSNV